MNDYVTKWIDVTLPETRSTAEVLTRYGLPETYQHAFGVLLRLLVSAGRETSAGDPELRLMGDLGRAFHNRGAGNPDLGFKYMQAVHAAACDVYRFDLSILSSVWSGIGRWLN